MLTNWIVYDPFQNVTLVPLLYTEYIPRCRCAQFALFAVIKKTVLFNIVDPDVCVYTSP